MGSRSGRGMAFRVLDIVERARTGSLSRFFRNLSIANLSIAAPIGQIGRVGRTHPGIGHCRRGRCRRGRCRRGRCRLGDRLLDWIRSHFRLPSGLRPRLVLGRGPRRPLASTVGTSTETGRHYYQRGPLLSGEQATAAPTPLRASRHRGIPEGLGSSMGTAAPASLGTNPLGGSLRALGKEGLLGVAPTVA